MPAVTITVTLRHGVRHHGPAAGILQASTAASKTGGRMATAEPMGLLSWGWRGLRRPCPKGSTSADIQGNPNFFSTANCQASGGVICLRFGRGSVRLS